MKLSIESKVAAAVAAACVASAAGVMAQGHSMGQTGGPNNFGPMNNPGLLPPPRGTVEGVAPSPW
jgi:hypothetical protein